MFEKLYKIISSNIYIKYILTIAIILVAAFLIFGMGKRFGEFLYFILN
ncbi:MAG: hypothetical protein IJM37_06870 [Lachnospiraceae bacterium]|nr:hypothetical protein [Lachnospiraceae bacterium]